MKHIHTFESFLIEKETALIEGIIIDPSRYVRTHGKAPKGNGIWAFEVGGEEVMTPKSMSYADAQKWAKDQAEEKKVNVVYTLG